MNMKRTLEDTKSKICSKIKKKERKEVLIFHFYMVNDVLFISAYPGYSRLK